mmetsp:Transcript_34567/g.56537  ORF Transcript_34567/g.56537 Transcript_34567/m.56537 type:complete len:202 (-) Transcript_34567:220-825(-)
MSSCCCPPVTLSIFIDFSPETRCVSLSSFSPDASLSSPLSSSREETLIFLVEGPRSPPKNLSLSSSHPAPDDLLNIASLSLFAFLAARKALASAFAAFRSRSSSSCCPPDSLVSSMEYDCFPAMASSCLPSSTRSAFVRSRFAFLIALASALDLESLLLAPCCCLFCCCCCDPPSANNPSLGGEPPLLSDILVIELLLSLL